jgi:hypothetical protein
MCTATAKEEAPMTDTIEPRRNDHVEEGYVNDERPRSRRWHRGPKGADLLDLVFKISSRDGWSATLRNNPSVVLVARNGDELAELTRELALAILQHRYSETLSAMRTAGSALPVPDPQCPEPGSVGDGPGERSRNQVRRAS